MDRAPAITVHHETVSSNPYVRSRVRLQTFLEPWTLEPQYAVSVEYARAHGPDVDGGYHPYDVTGSTVWNDPRDATDEYHRACRDNAVPIEVQDMP